jgi:hypothetical protein
VGLARDLTMGTTGGRRRGPGRFTLGDEFVRLRALTKLLARPGTIDRHETAGEVRRLVEQVSALPRRFRFEEGAILNAACAEYRRYTGESIGPETGVL